MRSAGPAKKSGQLRAALCARLRGLCAGAMTPPTLRPAYGWLPFLLFAITAPIIACRCGLVSWRPVPAGAILPLPFMLFVFPTLPEEFVFRGLLMPRAVAGRRRAAIAVGLSTGAFVVWHPLNAWLFNPGARGLFYDPCFLALVAGLGSACATGYAATRSLWVPVLMHWATLMVWVGLFGGRNLMLGR